MPKKTDVPGKSVGNVHLEIGETAGMIMMNMTTTILFTIDRAESLAHAILDSARQAKINQEKTRPKPKARIKQPKTR